MFSTISKSLVLSQHQTEALRRKFRLIHRHFPLLLRAWIVLACVRVTLSVSSFRPVLKRISAQRADAPGDVPPQVMAWAVWHAARAVPAASCLTQALTLRYLFARSGVESRIRIGVRLDPNRRFKAHAWVDHAGQTILGGSSEDITQFRVITEL